MNQKLLCLSSIVGMTLAFGSQNSVGQVLLGNYGTVGPSNDSSQTGISEFNWKAVGFTTANNGQSYNIGSVDLRLDSYGVSDHPKIGFFSNVSGHPGSLLGGTTYLNEPGSGSGPATFTFTPASTITLSPNTSSWLVVSGGTGSSLIWNASSSNTPTDRAPVSDYGATWNGYQSSGTSGASWGTVITPINSFRINATPVPEPAQYTLAGAGVLLGFSFLRKWFNR